jgi:hypothetical protein
MATAKKAAAPKAAPKATAPKAPLADAGSVAPGAGQAGDGGGLALPAGALAAVSAVAAAAGAQAGTPDGPGEPQGAAPELAKGTVAVSCAKGLERFHRCGMRFTREPTTLVVAELAEGVLERLQDEPRLVVQKG